MKIAINYIAMTELGKKLRTLRAEKGYTQEKIADLLGIHKLRILI